nr:allophanate hydrolase [Pseudomonadota bacterium]
MYDNPRFLLAGDRGLLVEFGATIDPEINRRVRELFLSLEK